MYIFLVIGVLDLRSWNTFCRYAVSLLKLREVSIPGIHHAGGYVIHLENTNARYIGLQQDTCRFPYPTYPAAHACSLLALLGLGAT